MNELKFLVIEYFPHLMDAEKQTPVRIDGHYSTLELASEVADIWTKNPIHVETRIVVAEIRHQAKIPKHWDHRNKDEGLKQ